MIKLKCRTAERPIAGRRAFNLPQGMRARLFRCCRMERHDNGIAQEEPERLLESSAL